MNVHPKTTDLAENDPAETPALPDTPDFAEHLVQAATCLFPHFEAGQTVDAKILRSAMEDAFGASDTEGVWVWKDAYDAAEVAQIMMLCRYGALMQRQAASPAVRPPA